MLCSFPCRLLQTHSSSGLQCSQVVVTSCVTSWHPPEQELAITSLLSLASIPLSVLLAIEIFSFSVFHTTQYSSHGKAGCPCLMDREELLVSWLSCSHDPDVTMLTTEQLSKCHALRPGVFRGAAVPGGV